MDTSITDKLPLDCISNIVWFTSPRDACRSSLVSQIFRSAASSDLVWERFLPPDFRQIISQSESPASSASSSLYALSKKDLYFHLCHNPILIDNGKKSFSIEESSGKKCYMLGARDLAIVWGDTPKYWSWISSATLPSLPKSRFSELAVLLKVCWLEITGRIETKILSPDTRYGAYFIYAIRDNYRWTSIQMEGSVNLKNGNNGNPTTAYLLPKKPGVQNGQLPHRREDMWLEIELGEFFNGEVDSMVNMRLRSIEDPHWKSGLVVHGIEVRPKE